MKPRQSQVNVNGNVVWNVFVLTIDKLSVVTFNNALTQRERAAPRNHRCITIMQKITNWIK